ncbi:GFA family protein [soil metagenome]
MNPTHVARCLCGAVTVELLGEPLEMGYCHCAAGRAYSGAPVTAFALYKSENVRVISGAEVLGRYQSSEMTVRRFCSVCGGQVMAEHPAIGYTDFAAAVVTTLQFKPQLHLNYDETVLRMRDGLPKLKDFPAHAGGSGELMPE